jgi:non-heme chloroperoxidase
MHSDDKDPELPPDSIKVPTLILHGVEDRVSTFDLSKSLREGINGSKLVKLEIAGHGFCFYSDERERFNSAILGFLPKPSYQE